MSTPAVSQIIMRIPLDRPPTEKDRRSGVGRDLFEARLLWASWIDEAGNILKRFRVSVEEHTENGEFYLEWKAVLQE